MDQEVMKVKLCDCSGLTPHKPDGPEVRRGGEEMPDRLTIGTDKAFARGHAFSGEKKQIGSETIYICSKGSQWARPSEVLVLRRVDGTWFTFDSAFNAQGSRLHCRHAVFRCIGTDITQKGWHKWEINHAASRFNHAGLDFDWDVGVSAETRVP